MQVEVISWPRSNSFWQVAVRNRGGATAASAARTLQATGGGSLDLLSFAAAVCRGFPAEDNLTRGPSAFLPRDEETMLLVQRVSYLYVVVLIHLLRTCAAAGERVDDALLSTSTSTSRPTSHCSLAGGGAAAAATALLERNYRADLEATIPSPLIDPHQVPEVTPPPPP